MKNKAMVWSIVVAAVVGLLLPPPVSLASDMEIERKECGCPPGWIVVAGGKQCLSPQTEEIVPYCRDVNA